MAWTGSDPDALTAVVERLRLVPSAYRRYTENREDARRRYGISADLVAALLEVGLPHRVTDGQLVMDRLDLDNASLQLGLPSPRAMALRGWGAALGAAARPEPTSYRVTFKPRCPEPGHAGQCVIGVRPPVLRAFDVAPTPDPPQSLTACVSVRTGRTLLPESLRDLVATVSGVRFHLLPPELHDDVGFLRATRLADCPLAAEFLLQEARRRGHPARKSFGVFLSVPYSIPHLWLEVRVDGQWRAIDPLLLELLRQRDLLDGSDWPLFRTLGGQAWRIGDEDMPLAVHNGQGIPCSLPTERR